MTISKLPRRLPFFALLLACAFTATSSRAQELLSRPLDIGELTQSAGTIIHGRVVRVQQGSHPDYPNVAVVNVTVDVLRNVRGAATSQISFRQWVQPIRRLGVAVAPARKVRALAGYSVGEEVVLFLYPNSRYGLTSPVGAEQGKFSVVHSSAGVQVRNTLGNAALFSNVQATAQRAGVKLSQAELAATAKPNAIDLTAFLNLVSRFAQAGGAQ